MKILTAYLLIILSFLAGCTSDQNHKAQGDDTPGYEVLGDLTERYNNSAMTCKGNTPAFHCTGVLARVTDTLETSPSEQERNTVAFTFLRQDTDISHLYRQGKAGIVLRAIPYASVNGLNVRCSFPVNANTDARPDGCGKTTQTTQDPELSRYCDVQGVLDVERWHAHWLKIGKDQDFTCAFRPSAEQFALSIKARNVLEFYYRKRWNEVVTSAWRTSDLGTVPFQAFFHNPSDPTGLKTAQELQVDFYTKTKIILPIIRLVLCGQTPDTATFDYKPEDQLLRPPLPTTPSAPDLTH